MELAVNGVLVPGVFRMVYKWMVSILQKMVYQWMVSILNGLPVDGINTKWFTSGWYQY